MIQARNISKHFGNVTAVNHVSFEVEKGETMVLLGMSGCGKTTTLKLLNRLIQASSGDIMIQGQNIESTQPEILRRGIGYVSQHDGLFPHYTVEQNIAIVPKLMGWDKKKILQKTNTMLDQLRLPYNTYAKMYPANLSGGQKQRVALARALVANPPVVLMDEPFSALDPITRMAIRNEFKALNKTESKTTILVTHDVPEAFDLGDKICLMHQGQIVQYGTPRDLLFKPINDYSRNFFNHQRLQLELTSIVIKDVWNQLPDIDTPVAADIQSYQNLWTAMELLTSSNMKTLRVCNEQSTAWKELSLKVINDAYIHFRQNV
jgi:osmoprotectant transport system ATP-binding protein